LAFEPLATCTACRCRVAVEYHNLAYVELTVAEAIDLRTGTWQNTLS
jgi:hypothetical protein